MLWAYNGKWNKVEHLRGAFADKIAVIACNGPSLNEVDCSTLKGPGRVVIAVNNAYPKVTPDFWIGLDSPDNYKQTLWAEPFQKITRSNLRGIKVNGVSWMDVSGMLFADMDSGDSFEELWGKGMFRWERHTFGMAIQFAHYLGCREVVLVGVDLDNTKQHYADGNYLSQKQADGNKVLYDAQVTWLKNWLKEPSRIRISSASPNSRINDFLEYNSWESIKDSLEKPIPKTRPKMHCQECNEFLALEARGGKDYSLGHQQMYAVPIELMRGIPASIIEVGFGIGFGLKKMLGAGVIKTYFGCEPCKDSFDYTLKNQEPNPAIQIKHDKWGCIEGAEAADFSLCIEVIEHLELNEIMPMLLLLRKKTKKALFLSTPDKRDSSHGVFTSDEIVNFLHAAGFNAVVLKHQWTTMFIATPIINK